MSTIFITGASGVVGSALIPVLMEDPAVRLLLLLRPRSSASSAQRLSELSDYWKACGAPAAAERCTVVEGDIERPALGLERSHFLEISAGITHIIHSAASVSLNQELEAARQSAVSGTNNILDLARNCRSLKALAYVSTVGVSGRGSAPLREERLLHARSFHNSYEAAKAEAEEQVWQAIDAGLPALIFRPSMVVGDSRSGQILHFQVFYHLLLFLSGLLSRGFVPHLGDYCLDIIPVDFLSRLIVSSLDRPELLGGVYHACSGAQAVNLFELARSVRALLELRGVSLPALKVLPRSVFTLLLPLLKLCASAGGRRALRSLDFFLEYLREAQHFENSRMLALAENCGLLLPAPNEYLESVLEYFFQKRPEVLHCH